MKFDPTTLIRPSFSGPLVAVLTGFHCISTTAKFLLNMQQKKNKKDISGQRHDLNWPLLRFYVIPKPKVSYFKMIERGTGSLNC